MPASPPSEFRLRLAPEQRQSIERLAARDQVSAEEAVVQAVESALQTKPSAFPPGTPFHGLDDLLSDLGDGPPDLSTNQAYLDDLGGASDA